MSATTTEDARRLFGNAGPLTGQAVKAYFDHRCLAVPETKPLRFAPSLWHTSGASYPAIIARVDGVDGAMIGAQRTFLALDGSGKAPVPKNQQRMSLGSTKGGMVRLAEPTDGHPLIIGEGIETVVTAMQAAGCPGWVTLGTSGLGGADLPDNVKDVILLGENDQGKNAKAIAKAALELMQKGIRVRVASPPEGVKDFNDMVMGAADLAAAFEAVRAAIADAKDYVDPLDDLVERAKTDSGAAFEFESLRRLADLRRDDPPRYARLYARLKGETKCRVSELERRLNQLSGGPRDDKSPSEILIELATDSGSEFFHTDVDDGYAVEAVGNHRETFKIGSRYFASWLTERFYRLTGDAPAKSALDQATATLKAKALYDGDEREVFVRVAACGDRIYFDLCDAERQAVEIDAAGWRVVVNPPVHFPRIRGMLPLPIPTAGGSIQLLRPFLNIEPLDKEGRDPSGQFALIVGWIVGAFRGKGPYAILVTLGEQGTAKTTFCRLMRYLVDPNFAPLRDPPADKRELAISSSNAHVLGYDNVSVISKWLSDAWCRRATGAGNSERELYTDDEEVLTNRCNPMVVNGIAEFVDRPDLAERSIFINLLPIPDEARKTENALFAEFDATRPKILGAIFDLLSTGLRRIKEVERRGLTLPRMADFGLWAIACTEEMFGKGTFKAAYDDNVQDAVGSVLEANPVALALIAEMDAEGAASISRTSGQWLEALSARAGKRISKSRDWPSTPRGLSAQLKRAAGYLRQVGFDVSPSKRTGHSRDRVIFVCRTNMNVSKKSSASARREEDSENSQLASEVGGRSEEAGPSAPPEFNPIVREDGAGRADASIWEVEF